MGNRWMGIIGRHMTPESSSKTSMLLSHLKCAWFVFVLFNNFNYPTFEMYFCRLLQVCGIEDGSSKMCNAGAPFDKKKESALLLPVTEEFSRRHNEAFPLDDKMRQMLIFICTLLLSVSEKQPYVFFYCYYFIYLSILPII